MKPKPLKTFWILYKWRGVEFTDYSEGETLDAACARLEIPRFCVVQSRVYRPGQWIPLKTYS